MLDKQIIFITTREHNIKNPKIKITNSLSLLDKELSKVENVPFDREFNSLVTEYAQPLLSQYGFKDKCIVVDDTSLDVSSILEKHKDKTYIGHNIEIDYRITKYHNKVSLRNLWDTLLVEREVRKGIGFENSLDEVLNRRLGIKDIDKNHRERFSTLTKTSTFIDEDIIYAARDVMYMLELVEVQQTYLNKFNLNFLLKDIRFKMIPILSDCSLEGIDLIEDNTHPRYDGYSWTENITALEKEAEEIKCRIDNILLDIHFNTDIGDLSSIYIKLKKPRRKQKNLQTDLFGDSIIQYNKNIHNVNYSSPKQTLEIFKLLDLPLPKKKDKDKKLGKKIFKNSIAEEALILYLNNNVLHGKVVRFVSELLKLSKVNKALNSFGDRFLVDYLKVKGRENKKGYKNKITKKIHTIYRQSTTETGRLASGNAAVGFYNSQQIKKAENYRHCFTTDEGYNITTCDLSGAELVIAASLSKDPRLIELVASGDPHTPLAQVGYNAMIKEVLSLPTNVDRKRLELRDILEVDITKLKNPNNLSEEEILNNRVEEALKFGKIVLNKKDHNDIRDKYKGVNYGLAYGAGAERIGDVLKVAAIYAKAVENAMKLELPILFDYLDSNSRKGLEDGFIIFNDRTNSRHWFKALIDRQGRRIENVSFGTQKDIERACKNYPIQGTQSDMIMEATVRFFFEYVYPNNYDITLLLHVHDEMAIKHRIDEPEHGKVLSKYMNETAELYLADGIKMNSEPMTLATWTK